MSGALKPMGERRSLEVVEKPWGREEIFARTSRYAGKILVIRGGEALSLQYHRKKDETLMLLEGSVKLSVGGNGHMTDVMMVPGDAYHITSGTRHRMEALTDSRIVEVSTPELDDVVRLDDRYGRAVPE